jgi:predicted RNA-binding Zn ribbon-like protein
MALPIPSQPRFLYVGGEPALDLVNTVNWTSRGPEAERLESYEGLTRWAEGARVIDAAMGRRLRRVGAVRPRVGEAALAYAHRARRTLRDLFGAIARGEPTAGALQRLNRLLADAVAGLEVAPAEGQPGRFEWRWSGEESDPRAIVWRVIWSAASLLRSEEAASIRVCDGDDCGWMFVDRSRNGLRRWCQMRTCGTMEKTRRRRVDSSAS